VNSTIAIVTLILWGAIVIALSAFAPTPLSDANDFLKGFVNHEFLSFMGVVVTITLASAGNLYVEMNKLEDRYDLEIFKRSKKGVKDSAYALVGALVGALLIVLVKPWIPFSEHGEALMNGAALGVILFSIMILIDLLQAAFNLDPRRLKGDGRTDQTL